MSPSRSLPYPCVSTVVPLRLHIAQSEIHDQVCCRLNWILPSSCAEAGILNVMAFTDGDPGSWLGLDEVMRVGPSLWISALRRKGRDIRALPLCHAGTQQEGGKSEVYPLQNPTILVTLSPELREMNFRGLSHQVCGSLHQGFPGGSSGKEPACQCRRHKRHKFDLWVGKIPWRRAQQPTSVFMAGESLGQRSLATRVPRVAQSQTQLK